MKIQPTSTPEAIDDEYEVLLPQKKGFAFCSIRIAIILLISVMTLIIFTITAIWAAESSAILKEMSQKLRVETLRTVEQFVDKKVSPQRIAAEGILSARKSGLVPNGLLSISEIVHSYSLNCIRYGIL
jgi:hypothetical protein